MRAMIFNNPHQPLQACKIDKPVAKAGEVLIKIHACAVCRTDLHLIDGELLNPIQPLVPGHEIVGVIEANGNRAERFDVGDRIGGVPWVGFTCGTCLSWWIVPGERFLLAADK
jgi:propanol-preferring alcohol dehydrogenase